MVDAYANACRVLDDKLTWGPVIGSPKFEQSFWWAQYNENGGSLTEKSDGISNDKDDRGGFTRYGITQGTAGGIDKVKSLTRESAKAIYRDRFWNSIKCEEMPPQLALILFDSGCGSGPNTAARWLQEVLGVEVDGRVGNGTLRAIAAHQSQSQVEELCNRLTKRRLQYCDAIYKHDPSQLKFKPGWTRRALFIRTDDWLGMVKYDRGAIDRLIAEQMAK